VDPIFADVTRWSDVVFTEWQTQAHLDISGLQYVFRLQMANDITMSVINTLNGHMSHLPWPGLTFPMTELQGLAILGTPNGFGVAWLLIQHRAQFGRRTIESVRVWSDPDSGNPRWCAYFKIVPMPVPEGG
jgi:hypothetical protein